MTAPYALAAAVPRPSLPAPPPPAALPAWHGLLEERVAELQDPLPDGHFDLVVSVLAVHHLVVRECGRAEGGAQY